jgi:hypothetical protein
MAGITDTHVSLEGLVLGLMTTLNKLPTGRGLPSMTALVVFLCVVVLTPHCVFGAASPLAVVAWGNNSYQECNVPADLTNVLSVVAGSSHNLALIENGTVKDWGGNGYLPPPGLNSIQAVSERFSVAFGLYSNGTVTAWGANYNGGRDVPPGLNSVVAIAAGNYHGLALKNDGTVVGWANTDGANVPTGLTNVRAIAAGIDHSLALLSNGTIAAWGWNNFGQASVPAGLSNISAISAGEYHGMALRSNGTVVVWGGQDASVQPPPGLSGVIAISAGGFHNLALRSNGTVIAWGYNSGGQSSVPNGLKDVVAISAGHLHSLALVVAPAPLILSQPQSATVTLGTNTAFSVSAAGSGPLSYQWRKDGSPVPSASGGALILTNVNFSDAGAYSVVITSSSGSSTSAPASLTVLAPPYPTLQSQPTDMMVFAGSNTAFQVSARGGTIYYQWCKDGTPIPGAASPTLSLSNVAVTNAGLYSVVVSNYSGVITSATAVLRVFAAADFSVTTAGGAYGPFSFTVNGQGGNPTLNLMRGRTYAFYINTGSSHPFQVSSAVSSSAYNDGVRSNNITSGPLIFTVPYAAPNTLRYICSVHAFSGTINVIEPPLLRILSVALTTNIVTLRALSTNGATIVPEFNSNILNPNWAIVPAYSNSSLGGTNVTVFNRLESICGPNVFLRVRSD